MAYCSILEPFLRKIIKKIFILIKMNTCLLKLYVL